MLAGANAHPWRDWLTSIAYIAQTGGTIVRWDEQIPATAVSDVVARYDAVTKLGLQAMIVLVPPINPMPSPTVFADYLKLLVPAMGTRTPIIEIGNEPNGQISGVWPTAMYAAALRAAWDASGPLKIASGGLMMNDQAYLSSLGNISKVIDYVSLHAYTNGGPPTALIGPYAPDDLDPTHNGRYSFKQGIAQTLAAIPKPLIVSEFGWTLAALTDAQRASYFRAAVSIARAAGVYALIAEEIGTGDGPAPNLTNTASWAAFMEAAH